MMPSSPHSRQPRARILWAFAALLLAGCAPVQPWQRGTFTTYEMRSDRDPLHTAMSEHIYLSREASTGGRGVGSSGCGCH